MFRNGLEPWHVILVVVVFVLLFGYKKMPDAARGLGKSLRILKSETRALREEGKEKETAAGDSGSTAQVFTHDSLEKASATPAAEPVKDEQRLI